MEFCDKIAWILVKISAKSTKLPKFPRSNAATLQGFLWLWIGVDSVSKRVLRNLLSFLAAILCIIMGYLAKKGFQRIFDGGKLTSKRGPPIKKWKFHVAQTWACGVSIQRQWSGMLALCTQKSIWVSVSGEVAQKGQISKCTLIFALFGLLLQIRSPKLISECTAPTFQAIASG